MSLAAASVSRADIASVRRRLRAYHHTGPALLAGLCAFWGGLVIVGVLGSWLRDRFR